MASVFLSYDREDGGRARSIAEALEEAGHSVWWDRHIRGGSQFTKEIEEALAKVEAVVVLWSVHSVDSAWVRDEAAAGRDTGRLVPARIDQTQPPLGFRQYQTIDLSNWKRRARSLRELVAAIESLGKPVEPLGPAPKFTRQIAVPWKMLGAAMLLLAVVGIGYFVGTRFWPKAETPTVTVLAADSSSASRDLASDLLIKLANLQSTRADMRLVDPGAKEGRQADLKFEVRSMAGPNIGASLALLSAGNRTILWSNDFAVSDGNRANLQQQLSYTAARLLGCALEGLPAKGPRLSQDLLRPYLNACSILGERYAHDVSQAIPLFILVTQKAPEFEPAWAKLLLAETDWYLALPWDAAVPLAKQIRRHVAQSRQVNPNLSEAFLAESELTEGDAFAERARLIDRALANDPGNVFALSARSAFYQDVGRMSDAVEDARRAAQLDPLSPALRNFHIGALAYSDRMPAAEAALADAERLWPGATTLVDARYRLSLRYGDPADALRLQDIGAVQAGGRLRESFLLARTQRTPENVEKAIAIAWSVYRRAPDSAGELVQTLGEFDREEELFPVLINWNRKKEIPFLVDVLFRPPLKQLWFDPRFMRVAKTFGLLDYWRDSETWPDFCADPDLPYDCKKEAARLGA